ncbi:hypothetical protein D0U04_02340 [Bacillus clarus]|uniref:Putative ribosomal L5 domain protein n=1 Tax=Bacillus clarus TaxID=2338372 RepID=A0A090YZI0_9BACI|nr:hypothetical protein [Bacillus clarus]KFN03792.1 putative ribosomal L5 domain protein [Bacillus clarus]RFT68310.1 hypothetical protein D0U04_02340 [Bacillus clarus]
MKRKYWLFVFIFLIASCSQVEQKKETKQVEETVNEVKETLQVTIIQKDKVDQKLKTTEAQLVVDIMNKAEKQEITGSFGEPEYEIEVEKNGKKETYYAWLRGEARQGWIQYKQGMYMLTKKDTEQLLSIFPNPLEKKTDDPKIGALTKVTKNDMQITAFHIKADEQKVRYTVRYTISDSLYNVLEKEKEYYLQLVFPEKIQKLVGTKASEIVLAEKAKEGYKQYEVNFTIPIKDASVTELKALEKYYDNYDLQMLNNKKEKVGVFQNIIQIVKDYGEKMNLQR